VVDEALDLDLTELAAHPSNELVAPHPKQIVVIALATGSVIG